MKMLSRFLFYLALCFFAGNDLKAEDGKNEIENDAYEAASLKSAYFANVESIKSMDVAINTVRFRHEEGMRAFEDAVLRERLLISEEQAIGLYVAVHEVRRSREGSKDEPTITKAIVSIQMGDRAGQRAFPEPTRWLRLAGEQTFAWVANYPDFRFLGRYPYPTPAGAFPQAVAESLLKAGNAAQPGVSLQFTRNQTAVATHRYTKVPGQVRVTHSSYDLQTNLLSGIRTSIHIEEPKEIVPQFLERYFWRQAGDLYVPARIEGEQRKHTKTPDGTPVAWNEHYDATFRWFAVNTDIDEAKVDHNLLSDLNLVLKFVEAQGETELVAD
jgi:hypothetical protein